MFDLLKQDVKVGNKVKLYLVTGKEPEGVVMEIGENFILLQIEDGTKSKFFDKLIGGWDIETRDTQNILDENTSIRLSKICRDFEIDLKKLVELFSNRGIKIIPNPNSKVFIDDLELIKPDIEKIKSNINEVGILDFIKEKISSEDKENPLSDTSLWRYRDWETDRKSTRLNSSHSGESRMPSSA